MDYEDRSKLGASLKPIIDDFSFKITPNFNNLIFLGIRGKCNKNLEEVVAMAASRDGYAGHKTFRYKKSVSHFYVRFRNAACAEKAIVYFRAMDNQLNADIVTNILRTWYMIERTFDETTVATLTYVDIQGNTDIPNLLSTYSVKPLLLSFVNSFTILYSSNTFPRQVLFSSMAEALAATIAVGGWFYCKDGVKNPQYSYRVRIVGKSKEAKIFEYCGSSSREAFEMDYFVPASEVCAEYGPEENDDGNHSSPKFTGKQSSSRGNWRGRHGGKYQFPKVMVPSKSTPDSNEIHD